METEAQRAAPSLASNGGPDTENSESAAALDRRLLRRSVSEIVGDHIRELVFNGELRDGERVPQREIAQALGVSSVPVREALAALQREGVVTIEPNRGAFVNGLDADVMREQFYLFGRIYGRAARVATERADEALLAELSDLAARMSAERDLAEVLSLSVRFQAKIVAAGGSRRLAAMLGPLSRIVPGNFHTTVPGASEVTRRGARQMVDAIRAGDPDAAERRCFELTQQIGELVAQRLYGRDE